jgi:RNA 2',3'-cyclic 3'-phosphodiesterase
VTAGGRRPRWPGADLPGRRLFVAVPFPSDAEAEIAAVVERVRADGVPGGGRDVRWVRLDSLHLTLRFLGPTLEEGVERAVMATRSAAAAGRPFDISIGGAGAFPSAARPRALWLDIRAGVAELAELAGTVDRELRRAGWELEDKPFRPHLTLARSDGVPAGSAIGTRLVAAAADLDVRFSADRVGLYESLTGGGPARYEPIVEVPLGPPG